MLSPSDQTSGVTSYFSIHFLLTITLASVLVVLYVQKLRRKAKAKAKAASIIQMPSLEEQERRIASFESENFRAECGSTSNVDSGGYRGLVVVESRRGCYVTVTGRDFKESTTCLDLATLDYHSFSTHPDVVEVARKTVQAYGVGSCGPRGFYGTILPHLTVEQDLAKFLGTDEAIVYSFSYATIYTIIPCFATRNDFLVCDSGAHKAICDGCQLSRANLTFFDHNDMVGLEKALQVTVAKDNGKLPHRRIVVTEGVFKNSGDICDLPGIIELCGKYKFRLLLDDSFGFGALGKTGRGTPEHYGIAMSEVDIYVGSLSTSLGAVGGFCAGETAMVDSQRLGATAYVFSASLPPYVTASASASVKLLDTDSSYVLQLQKNSKVMREALRGADINRDKISLVECRDDVSPLIVLAVTPSYTEAQTVEVVEGMLQKVLSKLEHHKILILHHLYNTTDRMVKVPSLRIVIKSKATTEEVEVAAKHVVEAVKSVFS